MWWLCNFHYEKYRLLHFLSFLHPPATEFAWQEQWMVKVAGSRSRSIACFFWLCLLLRRMNSWSSSTRKLIHRFGLSVSFAPHFLVCCYAENTSEIISEEESLHLESALYIVAASAAKWAIWHFPQVLFLSEPSVFSYFFQAQARAAVN